MKKLLYSALIAAGCLVSVVSFGQDHMKASPEERAKKMTDKMKTELSLTDDQYTKVHDINLKYAEKMQSVKQESGDHDAKMTEAKTLSKAKNDELKAVLTNDQWTKYQEMKKEMKGKMKGKMKEKAA